MKHLCALLLVILPLAACTADEPAPERTDDTSDAVFAEVDDYKPGDPINNLCAPVGAWCNTTTGKGYPYEFPYPYTYDPDEVTPECKCRCYTETDCAAAPVLEFPNGADCGFVPGWEPTSATFCRAK